MLSVFLIENLSLSLCPSDVNMASGNDMFSAKRRNVGPGVSGPLTIPKVQLLSALCRAMDLVKTLYFGASAVYDNHSPTVACY